MGVWMLDLVLVSLAVVLMVYVFYKLMFSADEQARREMALRPRPRFDRREAERVERRSVEETPPEGLDRRVGDRR